MSPTNQKTDRQFTTIQTDNETLCSLVENNKVIATCLIRDGNELSHVYVAPAYRGGGGKVLLDLCYYALAYVNSMGYDYIWGTLYKKSLAEFYARNGAIIEETPEQREDHKYLVRFYFKEETEEKDDN